MGLVALIAVLSVDVTRVLVANGLGLGYDTDLAAATQDGAGRFTATLQASTGMPYPPLAIVGCTGNAVPIVVTTAHPHGASLRGVGGISCIISGVTGNTNANNYSTDTNDRTVGLNQGVMAVPTGPTMLALYGQDQNPASATVGQLIPLVGNGAWTGGGTVVPALTDGSILMGRDVAREHSAPPRIIMVPTAARFEARTMSSNNLRNRIVEKKDQRAIRSFKTMITSWEVQCWGQATPPDPALDIDATVELPKAVMASAQSLFGEGKDLVSGTWDDEKARATQQIKAGHLFVFSFTIDTPILLNNIPFVPAGSAISAVVQTSTPEIGATINLPAK